MNVINNYACMKNTISNFNSWSLFIFLFPGVIYVSCINSTPHQTNSSDLKSNYKEPAKKKPSSSFSDTIAVDFPSAVFYNPDSLQLEKIKAITDTMIFESTVHDCFYQMRNSMNVLKQHYPHVRTIEVKNSRYIVFKKASGNTTCIDLNNENDQCGIIIFDGIQLPKLIDMTNIDSELGFYFSK
jgi:hypothetical protein